MPNAFMACTLLFENPQPLNISPAPYQSAVLFYVFYIDMKLDTIEPKVAFIMQKEKILKSVWQHLCCVVCSSLIMLDELHTLTCSDQHICASCLNALMGDPPCCPYCRSRPDQLYSLDQQSVLCCQLVSVYL